MANTAQLMGPYFDRIEQALLAIAPERNDELVSAIFKRELWNLTAIKGSPVARVKSHQARTTTQRLC